LIEPLSVTARKYLTAVDSIMPPSLVWPAQDRGRDWLAFELFDLKPLISMLLFECTICHAWIAEAITGSEWGL
jgi:hypothetical protein